MAKTITTVPTPVLATEMRLVPGHWPLTLSYRGRDWTRDRFVWARESLAFVVYRHGDDRIKVYNNHDAP